MLDDKDEFESAEAIWYRHQIEHAAKERRETIIAWIKITTLALLYILPTAYNVYKLMQDIHAGR